jgi:hypothetical protein
MRVRQIKWNGGSRLLEALNIDFIIQIKTNKKNQGPQIFINFFEELESALSNRIYIELLNAFH